MPAQFVDATGHEVLVSSTTLTASAVGVVTAGTIAGTTAAGAAPTVALATGVVANDRRGVFTLTPVTGGGAQAAGAVATVRFAQEYPVAPAVSLNLTNTTANPQVPILATAGSITTAGFSVVTAAALTTATNYTCSYTVNA
jgi:hypothetical protein